MTRIALLGSQQIAVGFLDFLCSLDDVEVALVVSSESELDELVGQESLLKRAKALNLRARVRACDDDVRHELASTQPDILYSVYHREILSQGALSIPRLGCVNIHPGRLPSYRGPTPTAWAILNGETSFGITIHHMDAGIDTGDVLFQEIHPIDPDETGYELHTRAMHLGTDLLCRTFRDVVGGTVRPTKQEGPASYYGKLKTDYLIDWQSSVETIRNAVRVFASPYSRVETTMHGTPVLVNHASRLGDEHSYRLQRPGEIVDVLRGGALVVSAADGFLVLEELEVLRPIKAAQRSALFQKGNRFGSRQSTRLLHSRRPRTERDRIPFNASSPVGKEIEHVVGAVQGHHISGNGPYTRLCEALFESELGVDKCFLTASGTDALQMSALLLDVRDGDEVIVPAFTFPSTVNAFAARGARPVFVDIRPDTLNLDEAQLEALITSKTKVIVPVHYAGVACEMGEIMRIAAAHDVPVVEDNAHGLFAKYGGRPLGTFGSLAALSFHETKNFTCGEGGALLINDASMIERAEFIIQKGTDRSRFERGEVDKYTWVELGAGHRPSDMLAGFLFGQLERRKYIRERRKRIFDVYDSLLRPQAEALGVQLPTVPSGCEQSYHMYYVVLSTEVLRDKAIQAMANEGIVSVFHYMPLHLSSAGRKYGSQRCPVTESVSSRLLRLPFYVTLSEDEQERVVDALVKSLRDAPVRV